MKINPKIFFLFIIFLVIAFPKIKAENPGIIMKIRPNTVENIAKSIIPYLDLVREYTIPDKTFSFEYGVIKITINLKNIKLNIAKLDKENINIKFGHYCIVNLKLSDIEVDTSFDLNIKSGVLSKNNSASIELKKLNINVSLLLKQSDSKDFPGKKILNLDIIYLNIDYDYDFDIDLKLLGIVSNNKKNQLKAKLKKMLNNYLQENMNVNFGKIINTKLQEYFTQMKISDSIYIENYLLGEPVVDRNTYHLILKFTGKFFNSKFPQSKTPIFRENDFEDFNNNSDKDFSILISEYSLNTALNSFALDGRLKKSIKNSDLPETSPIELTTDGLNALFPGIVEKYGEKKNLELNIELTDVLNGVKLTEGNINFDFKVFLDFVLSKNSENPEDPVVPQVQKNPAKPKAQKDFEKFVKPVMPKMLNELDEPDEPNEHVKPLMPVMPVEPKEPDEPEDPEETEEQKKVTRLELKINSNLDFELQKEGSLKIIIKELKIQDLNVIEKSLETISKEGLFTLFRFITSLAPKVLNNTVFKDLKIKLPQPFGINFNDSYIIIREKAIEIGVNPDFGIEENFKDQEIDEQKIDNFNPRRNVVKTERRKRNKISKYQKKISNKKSSKKHRMQRKLRLISKTKK